MEWCPMLSTRCTCLGWCNTTLQASAVRGVLSGVVVAPKLVAFAHSEVLLPADGLRMKWVVVHADNYLNEALPQYDALAPRLCRSAFIGFAASLVRLPSPLSRIRLAAGSMMLLRTSWPCCLWTGSLHVAEPVAAGSCHKMGRS